MRALSIRQPWAWLIVNGHKPIENREWRTAYRGPVLIHAGKTMARTYYDEVAAFVADEFEIELPAFELLERGGIVGTATITDCVSTSDSPWFQGPFGFVMTGAKPLPFHPCRGMLNFFDVRMPL
jgi:hypothetical protein